MKIDFQHHQAAHCENGVASNILKHRGLNLSEPMVFGLGSGIFYVYIPFLIVNQAPAISYRPMPGSIFAKAAKRLGIKIKREKFSNPEAARKALDENLAQGIPSGLQVGVFHLPYFPDQYRFHFNAHNMVVFGKEGDNYLISDPVMELTTTLSANELDKVRFAQGAMAPKGHMYYPVHIPKDIDLPRAIRKAIKSTCSDMLAPIPIIGVRGERYIARKIKKWPEKVGTKKTNHYLAQIVRMQEEIGTGGGGFRYIYAAFLQEASPIIEKPELMELSAEMTAIGDEWRDFALNASRILKNRKTEERMYIELGDQMERLADREEAFFKKLRKVV
jgi:hypothetical protein